KHPHELLDSVVKERLVKSFSSQPRRAFYAFLRACQAFILKFFVQLQPLDSLRSLVAGGEFYSVSNRCQLPFFTAADLSIEAPPDDPGTANPLKFKEFSVPTAPEVGRIIERSEGASRTYFNFVSAGAFWL
ncbi:hypothetical protein ACIOVF_11230, partial [Pseudomonas sp. NPDC087612]|uniref:hypothetical protein n=1 Tax=Pseudomonas sp. NPDC087612 TaxID=3364441 RepID=UPI00380FFC99